MRLSRITLLKLGSLASFLVAYQFTTHGVTLKDSRSLSIGYIVFVVAILLTVYAFRIERWR